MRSLVRFAAPVLILALVGGLAFASGGTETAETTGAASDLRVLKPGETVIWGTQAAFEKDTGKQLPAFSEAPTLATRVKTGELPAVEERMPQEVVVVDPYEEMGVYGGDYRIATITPNCCGDFELMFTRFQNILTVNPAIDDTIPNIAQDWDFSSDYKTITLFLRKGMKWSDGAPFTADDFVFWWEDFVLNKDLAGRPNPAWAPGGTPMTLTKIDETTVRMEFAVPYPIVTDKLAFSPYARGRTTFPVTPKHFLSQYHIKYNSNADAEAKKAGFDSWKQRFLAIYADQSDNRNDPGFPTVEAWMLVREDDLGNRYFERNPYYWKVDTAGRQLPYMDTATRVLVENREVAELKSIAGEFITARSHLQLKNWPLYKENEAKGDYKAYLWDSPVGSEMRLKFNTLYEGDPVLRDIMADIRFRQALSMAIDREEINKLLFFGRAVPRQAAPPPLATYYEDWMGSHYAELDLDKANKLLDEMGLKWDANKQWRIRPDGETLTLLMEYFDRGDRKPIFELVKEYWEVVGVKITLKQEEDTLYASRRDGNQVQVPHHPMHLTTDVGFALREAGQFRPGAIDGNGPWDDWWTSRGAQGVEPPEDVKKIYALLDEYLQTPLFTDRSKAIGKEYSTLMVKNLWSVGTVGMAPVPVIIKNGLINVPEKDWWWPEGRWFNNTIPEQWFLR